MVSKHLQYTSQDVKAVQSGNKVWSVNRVYYEKYFFFEKSYAKCGGETIPRPFSKISKLSISPD